MLLTRKNSSSAASRAGLVGTGPDSVFVVGSSKHNNEQSDHQARICHSTTVAGVAENGCKTTVVDPRFTRTAARADRSAGQGATTGGHVAA